MKINPFESGNEIFSRIISGQYGVRVNFRPDCKAPVADLAASSITLPELPTVIDADALQQFRGYVDHETAHVMFTKYQDNTLPQKASGSEGHLQNALEDGRIERLISGRYYGSKKNIDFMNDKCLFEVMQKLRTATIDEETKRAFVTMLKLTCLVYTGSINPLLKGSDDLLGRLPDELIADVKAIRTYEDVESCARRINDLLFNKPEEDQPSQGGGDSDRESEESENGDEGEKESKGTGSGFGKEEEASEEASDEGSDEEEASDKASDEDSARGETRSGEKGPGMPGTRKTSGHASGGDGSNEQDEGKAYTAEERADLFSTFADEMERAEEERKAQVINAETGDNEESGFRSYKTVYHVDPLYKDVRYENENPNNYFSELIGGSGSEVRSMRQKLIRDLQTMGRKFTNRTKSGRLSASNVARVKAGYEDIFKSKMPKIALDTAVSLVIDCSGSMRSIGKIRYAMALASIFSEALEAGGVPHEILGFTTIDWGCCGPIAHLKILEFKPFNVKYRSAYKCFSGILKDARVFRNTMEGESILFAAKRLAGRRERRKVMLVLSDGMPECIGLSEAQLYATLKSVIGRIERSGIEILGIGIQSDAVARFYKNYVVFNDLGTFITTTYAKIARILQGKKAA